VIGSLVAAGGSGSIEFNAADVFVVLLIGLGPLKAALVYLASTAGLDQRARRRVALRAVMVAGIVAVLLFVLGAGLARLLHFSNEALAVAGGLVLLTLGIQLIIPSRSSHPDPGGRSDVDPDAIAIFPLALPLLLNPIGIVALFTYSGSFDVEEGLITIALIGAVLAVDVIVFLLLSRAKPLDPNVVSVVEIVLGFLLAALAIEMLLSALGQAGVITYQGGS
jgi:multiple antibiotic resistance protein